MKKKLIALSREQPKKKKKQNSQLARDLTGDSIKKDRRTIGEILDHGPSNPLEKRRLEQYLKKLKEFYQTHFEPSHHILMLQSAVNASLIELRLVRGDLRHAVQSGDSVKLQKIADKANELLNNDKVKLNSKPAFPEYQSVSYKPDIGYGGHETIFVTCRDCKKKSKIRTHCMGKAAPPHCRHCGGILELK